MKELTEADRFAILSYARDVEVGTISGKADESWDNPDIRKLYVEEAEYYSKKDKKDWPCGILMMMGIHIQYHQDCNTTDWRE